MTTAPQPRWSPTAVVGLAAAAAGLTAGLALNRDAAIQPLAAMTSLSHESFAVCTAPIDGSVEGFFVLDFETGDLTGGVINPATSKFGASFRHNVFKDFGFKPGKVKNPKFLLSPGMAASAGAASTRMAASLLYVTDAATGVTVAYGIPWNAQQAGGVEPLVPLDVARPRGGGAKVP